MLSSPQNSPSIFKRLRNTPKTLRRKLKISQGNNNCSKEGTSNHAPSLKTSGSKKKVDLQNLTFNCRYLGKRSVYNLKPENGYEFGLKMANCVEERTSFKTVITIHPKSIDISYQPTSPTAMKQKLKFSQSVSSPFIKRAGARTTSIRPRNECCHCSATTVFDQEVFSKNRPASVDESTFFSWNTTNESNNNSCEKHSKGGSKQFLNVFDSRRDRSRTHDGHISTPDGYAEEVQIKPEIPQAAKILLHEVAYCVTIPEKPRVFLLTCRNREGLVCQAFLFSTSEKADALKIALANQFQNAYVEWQARQERRIRRASLAVQNALATGSMNGHVPDASNSIVDTDSYERQQTHTDLQNDRVKALEIAENLTDDSDVSSDEDDDLLSEEEEAMNREFTRRASCLPNPERLSLGEDEISEQLQQNFEGLGENDEGENKSIHMNRHSGLSSTFLT